MANYDEQNVYRAGAGVGTAADIDEGLRAYMLRVYNFMALGIAFTAIITLLMMNNPQIMLAIATGPVKWVVFAAILGMGFFAHKLILTGSTTVAHASYWTYCALWGVLISPMVYVFVAKGQTNLVFQAFAITSVTFGATSLFGYVTKKNLSAFGTFLAMATIGLLVAMLANAFFFKSEMMSLIVSCLVVLVFAAITAWETQEIKEMYYGGDDQKTATGKAIFGAFLLFGSFITIFIHVLNILGILSGDD